MSYHNSSFHPEPLDAFPSGTPDRFPKARHMGELETPMRDGVVLRSDLTLPVGCDRAPVILIRQPYGRDPRPAQAVTTSHPHRRRVRGPRPWSLDRGRLEPSPVH